jgi:hypothetical protein
MIILDLVEDKYSFGRGDECDHQFVLQNGSMHFMALKD